MKEKNKYLIALIVNTLLGLYLLLFYTKSVQLYGVLLLAIGNFSTIIMIIIHSRKK